MYVYIYTRRHTHTHTHTHIYIYYIYIYIYVCIERDSTYCCTISKKKSTNPVGPTFYSYFKESFSCEYHKRDNNKSPLL